MSVSIQLFLTGNQTHVCPNCGDDHLVSKGKHFVDEDFGEAICDQCVSIELPNIARNLLGGDIHAQ